MLKIIVKNRKTQAEQSFHLKKNKIVVGRSKQCDVAIESDTISRQHCQFSVGANEIFIEDLGSGNGTFVNNTLLPAKQKVPLKVGDNIRIEDFILEWQNDKQLPEYHSESPLDATDPDILEMKMIKKVIGAMSTSKKPQLIFISEPFQKKSLTLDSDRAYVIGRDPECDLSIDSPIMSRKHAQILSKWGTFVIEDLKSKNGTFVNGAPVLQETSLKDKDKVVFGTLEAILHFPETYNFAEIENSLQKDKATKSAKQLNESQSLSQRLIETKNLKDSAKDSPTKSVATDPAEIKIEEPKDKPKALVNTETPKPEPVDSNLKPAPKVKSQPALIKMLSGLSPLEWILFGFAGLVITILLFALKTLLS